MLTSELGKLHRLLSGNESSDEIDLKKVKIELDKVNLCLDEKKVHIIDESVNDLINIEINEFNVFSDYKPSDNDMKAYIFTDGKGKEVESDNKLSKKKCLLCGKLYE